MFPRSRFWLHYLFIEKYFDGSLFVIYRDKISHLDTCAFWNCILYSYYLIASLIQVGEKLYIYNNMWPAIVKWSVEVCS